MFSLSKITVAILAGGFGTRLNSVVKGQKVMAQVNSQPFLKYLLDRLNNFGFKRVVLCTGYSGEQVENHFGKKYKKLNIIYSKEGKPLGTAGTLRFALSHFKSKIILVMNGDSYCNVDLKKFVKFHLEKKAKVSLVTQYTSYVSRYGRVIINSNNIITCFKEKRLKKVGGWINCGIYLINYQLLSEIPKNIEISLEKEIFPSWIGRDFYGFKNKGEFLDIGTPQSFAKAENFIKRINKKRFVILDRDGTIIFEKNYLSDHNQVRLIPKVTKGLKKLKDLGLGLVVVTNQAGLGRGYFSLQTLKKIHKRLHQLLTAEGVLLDGIYFCPHHPDDNCLCRKPKLGLIKKAVSDHGFDPKHSFVIGDKALDIELGKAMGAVTLLVRTGYGAEVEKENIIKPDYIVDDLLKAADIIKTHI